MSMQYRSSLGKRKRYWKTSAPAAKRVRYHLPPRTRGYLRRGGLYGRYGGGRFSGRTGELKYHDTLHQDANVFNSVVQTPICLVSRGTGPSQRIGRKFTIKKININVLIATGAAVISGMRFRIALVQDTQANGENLTVTEVFQTDQPSAYRNLSNAQRFKILWTENHVINPVTYMDTTTSTAVKAGNKPFRLYSKNINCNIPIEFANDDTAGSLANLRSNNIALVYQVRGGDEDATEVSTECRIRFTDN